jgi:GT2 family glycosyltransferase
MLFSIVIVNYNGKDILEECISSIYKDVDKKSLDFEVIVVDNASSDGSYVVASKYPVTWIDSGSNAGYSRAVNLGARAASGKHIVILNNDIQTDVYTIRQLIEQLESNQEIACAAPKLLNLDGTPQDSLRALPSIFGEFLELVGLALIVPERFGGFLIDARKQLTVREVEQVAGAAMVVPLSVFHAIGGLDERYWLYYEDVDFCKRIRTVGSITYFPAIQMKHVSKGTASRYPHRTISAIAASRYKYFYFNHGQAQAELSRVISILRFVSRGLGIFMIAKIRNKPDLMPRARGYLTTIPILFGNLLEFNPLDD